MSRELTDKLRETLLKYWGHGEFRPMQLETILSVCAGRDTLSLMPTGAGKSLVYQLPTIAEDGFCVVITPLIALMKDQVDKLRARGVPAVAVHSGMTPEQIDIALDNCVYGDVKFLYVAPERIAGEMFRLRVPRMKPTLIAVDEAHCISQWGYDFRPSYLRIAELRTILPDVPVLALTASATADVAQDIMARLKFVDGALLRSPFARPNLSYSVRKVEDKDAQLMRVIDNVPGSGIVYVRTRQGVEQLADTLSEAGIAVTHYHGGMESGERTVRQEEWITGRKRIMVATNAFGMGIDKADVRFVVHYSICDSVENYYQEAGRAGRDGRKAYAVLLVSPDDRARALHRFSTEYPSIEVIKHIYESVFNYLQIAIGEGRDYSFDFNVYDFCHKYRLFAWTALNAIRILQSNGYMILTDESDHPARVMFTVSRDDLYRLRVEREELDHFLRVLLRMYNGLFSEFRPVVEQEIAVVSGYTVDKVKDLFRTLWRLRVIRYIPARRSPLLYFPGERLPVEDVFIAPDTYKIRKDLAAQRCEKIFEYAESGDECRSAWIQRYFGEAEPADCGVCDVCLGRKKSAQGGVRAEEVLDLLRGGDLTVKQIVGMFDAEPAEVIRVIDRLAAGGKITVEATGIVKINR